MKVMVIGGGGREHALAWQIAQSSRVEKVFVAPGNAGTALIAENLDILPTDIKTLGKIAQNRGIELVIVGPEIPLALGIVDYFDSQGIPVFGPTKAAAQIESSKVFARNLMVKYHIPCPRGKIFSSYVEARTYLEQQRLPVVVKADGLAAGKGVIIANSKKQAVKTLDDIMKTKCFGSAGDKVIIDEYLSGLEVSLIAFTDGKTVLPMLPACDYKKVWDNDQGPNTGGMGSYSPPGFFPAELIEKATNTILLPAVRAMASEGISYKGVLYAGLMLTDGEFSVLEFNCRFGDPETQALLPLLKTDFVDILLAVLRGNLNQIKIEWSSGACVGVVMASAGYPSSYKKGLQIKGLNEMDKDLSIFHAGTRLGNDGIIYTNGGRVLSLVGTGKNMAEAREKVYSNIRKIYFEGCQYRTDIALREVI